MDAAQPRQLKLDNDLLDELGLGGLPADQKPPMLQHIYDTLELRVGTNLANQMTDQQLDEFERFIDAGGDANQAQALQWLEANLPNYKQVVNEVFEALKGEIKAMAPQIMATAAPAPAGAGVPGTSAPAAPATAPGAPVAPAPAPAAPAAMGVPPAAPAPLPTSAPAAPAAAPPVPPAPAAPPQPQAPAPAAMPAAAAPASLAPPTPQSPQAAPQGVVQNTTPMPAAAGTPLDPRQAAAANAEQRGAFERLLDELGSQLPPNQLEQIRSGFRYGGQDGAALIAFVHSLRAAGVRPSAGQLDGLRRLAEVWGQVGQLAGTYWDATAPPASVPPAPAPPGASPA